MSGNQYYSDYDGAPVVNPSDLNYEIDDVCDSCGREALGIMYHAAGATGRVCPVLFVCHDCCARRSKGGARE
jgi:hypothetical protein